MGKFWVECSGNLVYYVHPKASLSSEFYHVHPRTWVVRSIVSSDQAHVRSKEANSELQPQLDAKKKVTVA